MQTLNRVLLKVVLLMSLLCACQPIQPPTPASTALPDIPGEILIPAGQFQMGCDENNPQEMCLGTGLPLHTIYLDTYYIDKFEVTNTRYLACVEEGICAPPRQTNSMNQADYFANPEFGDYPVLHMDWFMAHDFCEWEGKRLPTEAEWMKAARGPDDTRKYPWGDDAPTCELANGGCDWVDVSEVGSYPAGASPYGVMDMAGNVGEWANDWYAADYYSVSPSDNPQGADSGTLRLNLGGTLIQGGPYLAISKRNTDPANDDHFDHGIRCVHTP